jgi:hypothetical protein
MSRVVLMLLAATMLVAGMPANDAVLGKSEGRATPGTTISPIVGSWVVTELAPPSGGPAVLAGVATLFADGNALVSGFGAAAPVMQGGWIAAGERAATVTVVGLIVGDGGGSDGSLQRIRATLKLDATGDAFRGGYTLEVMGPDGAAEFRYSGPVAGTRITVEPPDPSALERQPGTPV